VTSPAAGCKSRLKSNDKARNVDYYSYSTLLLLATSLLSIAPFILVCPVPLDVEIGIALLFFVTEGRKTSQPQPHRV